MSTKKSELKVSVTCQKRKIKAMKAVTKLTGVDEVKLDSDKGILTVVGSVDPVCVAIALRKAGLSADLTSVGPPNKPGQNPKSPCRPFANPPFCQPYPPLGPCYIVDLYHRDDVATGCSIL